MNRKIISVRRLNLAEFHGLHTNLGIGDKFNHGEFEFTVKNGNCNDCACAPEANKQPVYVTGICNQFIMCDKESLRIDSVKLL